MASDLDQQRRFRGDKRRPGDPEKAYANDPSPGKLYTKVDRQRSVAFDLINSPSGREAVRWAMANSTKEDPRASRTGMMLSCLAMVRSVGRVRIAGGWFLTPITNGVNTMDQPLSPDLLQKMDAYWRAANYLSVGQIYLCDNPLLKEPFKPRAHQAAAAGPLGHDARTELHLRPSEPGDQAIRAQRHLHHRPRPRGARHRGQHVPGRDLQRAVSRRGPGRTRA